MKNSIEFTYIKKFDWLKNKNPMSLDFYLQIWKNFIL